MRVLVTGATGFIGKELLLRLREKGHDIAVLTRDAESSGVRLPLVCDVFEWDSSLLEPPMEAFEGVDAVVHLAGESVVGRWNDERKNEISRSRILSTNHLVQAFHRLENKPSVFVSTSATGYYGDRQGMELDETASPGHGFPSTLACDWEKEIFKAEDQGIRTVAMRTGLVLGHDGGAMKRMLPAFRMCLGARLGGGDQWMSWIHVRDLTGMIVHALENESVTGPMNGVGPNPVTNKEFTKALGRAVSRPTFLFIPKGVLNLVFGEMSQIFLDSQKILPKKAEDTGYQFEYPELEKALPTICNQLAHDWVFEQWVPATPEEVFKFFMDKQCLEEISPPWLKFKVLSQSEDPIQKGTCLNYRFWVRWIPMWWQSMIIEWEENKRFADIQVAGPYATWLHHHDFIEKDGGTIIRDRAVYLVPFCVPGDVVIHPFIRKDLEKIFTHRRKKIAEHFGAAN